MIWLAVLLAWFVLGLLVALLVGPLIRTGHRSGLAAADPPETALVAASPAPGRSCFVEPTEGLARRPVGRVRGVDETTDGDGGAHG